MLKCRKDGNTNPCPAGILSLIGFLMILASLVTMTVTVTNRNPTHKQQTPLPHNLNRQNLVNFAAKAEKSFPLPAPHVSYITLFKLLTPDVLTNLGLDLASVGVSDQQQISSTGCTIDSHLAMVRPILTTFQMTNFIIFWRLSSLN